MHNAPESPSEHGRDHAIRLPRRRFLAASTGVVGAALVPSIATAATPRAAHPVTITVDTNHPGPVVPGDFAGLSFEIGPLRSGNAGVTGYFFSPSNTSLVALFRNLGLRNLRVGGGTVDQQIPPGTGSDGFTGVDELFAFAKVAGAQVIYTLRLFNPSAAPLPDLLPDDARIAAYVWSRYRQYISSFAISNEPDWHSFHTADNHPEDPLIYETISGVPGTAYPSYLADWRNYAAAIAKAAPGAQFSGPDTGAYSSLTYTPNPESGVSWTEQFAIDEAKAVRMADITQHYYVGGSPLGTTAQQAIDNMLSPEWVNNTTVGTQPAGTGGTTTYTPYPWLYQNNISAVVARSLPYRLTESNDYLTGVPGASNGYAAALWTLDYMHWWAAHSAAGVNFHNKQWIYTDTIIPDPASPATRFKISPKGYGIKAFNIGSAGRVTPVDIQNADGVNVTAYCIGSGREYFVTVINKTQGAGAADATVSIAPRDRGVVGADVMTLVGSAPGDATGYEATLGGAPITGDAAWQGRWSPLTPNSGGVVELTVAATTAAVVRIRRNNQT